MTCTTARCRRWACACWIAWPAWTGIGRTSPVTWPIRWPSDGYHRFFGPITGRAAEPLLNAAQVGAGTRVLDVATGPGYIASHAVARGASVVGVDFAPEILALAASLNPAVEFRRGDAHHLLFEAGSFDAVVSGFVLPHLGDHAQAMDEFVRVLTPGGKLASGFTSGPTVLPILR